LLLSLPIQQRDGGPLMREPVGTFGDKVLAFIKQNEDAQMTLRAFYIRNAEAFKEYWARDKAGALAVKREFERVQEVAE
jgi:hypothetical protein